jgi:hypothetical protein
MTTSDQTAAHRAPGRALTAGQKAALLIAVFHGVTGSTAGSMPSLEGRGLMERYRHTEHGRAITAWRPTPAGIAEARRLQDQLAAGRLAW